jgi:hypothetical protein
VDKTTGNLTVVDYDQNTASHTDTLYIFKDGADVHFINNFNSAWDYATYHQLKMDDGQGKITDITQTEMMKSYRYVGRKAYYDIWLNNNRNASNANSENTETYRNDYFDISIAKINGIGRPYAEPSNPDIKPYEVALIEFTIRVAAWNYIDQSGVVL